LADLVTALREDADRPVLKEHGDLLRGLADKLDAQSKRSTPRKRVAKKAVPKVEAPKPPEPKVEAPKVEPKKPGLREGKTNIGRITHGDLLMGMEGPNGEWIPSASKTKGTPVKVTRWERVKLPGHKNAYTRVIGTTPEGKEVTFKPGPGIQTFWYKPGTGLAGKSTGEPATVVKKAVPEKKAPTPRLKEEHNPAKLEGPVYTIPFLREVAYEEGIEIPKNIKTRDEIRDFILKTRSQGFDRETLTGQNINPERLRRVARDEGIYIPARVGFGGVEAMRTHIQEQRALPKNKRMTTFAYKDGKDFPGSGRKFSTQVVGRQDRWVDLLTEDIPTDRPMVVKDLTIEGYHIKNGVIHRIDGIAYLVETDFDPNPRLIAGVVDSLRKFQESLPPGAGKFQQGYVWLNGRDPLDAENQIRYKNPNHTSLASAGDGTIHIFGRQGVGDATDIRGTLTHEYGHNVDYYDVRDTYSHRPEWARAARQNKTMVKHFQVTTPMATHPITLEMDPGRDWPHGVTVYGKSSRMEDFAESMRLYQAGIIGRGQLDSRLVDVYFRDLFPERAKILDTIYPAIAARQRAAIAARDRA
jgi:hypothetical protein